MEVGLGSKARWARLCGFVAQFLFGEFAGLEDKLRTKLGGVIPENKVAGYPNILIERKGI